MAQDARLEAANYEGVLWERTGKPEIYLPLQYLLNRDTLLMKVTFSLLVFVSVMSIQTGFGQENADDLAMVRTSVENYFQGYIHRDQTRLELAFDTENGTMKLPISSEAGEEGFENGYFKEIIPKWGSREKLSKEVLAKAKLEVHRIDVVSAKMAVAVIRMEVGDKVYVDVLSLQKMNTQWKITNKMYIAL